MIASAMLRQLSIKSLIAGGLAFILVMALLATAATVVTDRLVGEALERHEQAVAAVAEGHDAAPLAATRRDLESTMALASRVTLAIRGMAYALGLLLAVVVYRRVAELLASTESFAGRIETGDFAARFFAGAGGEAARLADALNRMVDRLQAAAEGEATANQRLNFLLAASPAVIYAAKCGSDPSTTYISPNITWQLGWLPADFIGDAAFWANNIHPDDLPGVMAKRDELFANGCVASEYRFRHRDGSWRWMHDEAVLVRDTAGAPQEIAGTCSDITGRKEIEESLQRRDAILAAVAYGSSRFLRASEEAAAAQWDLAVEAVLAHLGEATGVSRVWIFANGLDADGDLRTHPIYRWSLPEFAVPDDDPLFATTLSYRDEGMGLEALRLRRGEMVPLLAPAMPPSTRQRFERLRIRSRLLAPVAIGEVWWGFMAFDDCVAERPWTAVELEALAAAANLFGASIAARNGRDSLRASLERLGSAVAQLKRQSAEIERQNAELERANRMKTEFLAAITHELRTPLNVILGFADLLESGIGGTLAPAQKDYAGEIVGAGRKLLGVVNRMLELAQIEAGKKPFLPEATDLGALLRDAAAAHEAAARGRGVSIAVDTAVARVLLDGRLLRRLLDELIDNAIKFNRAGGSIVLRAETSAGLRIDVSDSGIGIPAESRERLFDSFVQVDGALTRAYGGTGLGLTLARRLAEVQGGTLTVDSTVGEGSTFHVWLPLRRPEMDDQATTNNNLVRGPA